MLSAFHSKTFTIVALILISVINQYCTGNSEGTKDSSFVYAESRAHIVEAGRESLINRKIYFSPDGIKVVNSDIESKVSLSGIKTSTSRILTEFLIGDSLFIYDSDDSTFLALSVFDDCDLKILPMSSAWLLRSYECNEKSYLNDTLTIAGYSCKKILTSYGWYWIFGNQPMGRVGNTGNCNFDENIIRCMTDTSLDQRQFVQPPGFRKVVPENQQ